MTAIADRAAQQSPSATDRYLVVSVDTHTGPYVRDDLRQYCPTEQLELYDEYSAALDAHLNSKTGSTLPVGLPSGEWYREWRYRQAHIAGILDPHARLKDMDEDGVAAEVIFHGALNDQPIPFSSTSLLSWSPPEFGALEAVGVRIYNRWLADFVSVQPHRRVGIAHVPISDIDAAVKEVHWAREHGLTAINLPAPRRDFPSYLDPVWEPFWAACADNDMVFNTHSGGGDYYSYPGPAATAVYLMEFSFFARRAMPVLIFGGVFERYPNLKLVLTEQASDWVPEVIRDMQSAYYSFLGETIRDSLPREPIEYFENNVFIGASFMAHHEVLIALENNIEHHFMWGSDYPHQEGTWPRTLESLRLSFHDIDPIKVQQFLGDNAIEVYGLDRAKLETVAARIGPTVESIAQQPGPLPTRADGLAFRTRGKYS